jgi:chromate transporter
LHEGGIAAQIGGAALAALGIFLPGTFLIFFIIRFWAELKKFRIVKASLDGITATSSGMVLAAAYILSVPLHGEWINYILIISTFLILLFTKIPSPVLIGIGLILGFVI